MGNSFGWTFSNIGRSNPIAPGSLRNSFLGIAIGCAVAPSIASSNIIFVRQDATGLGQGTSWANAFTSLSDALSIAQPNDQIWIARGTYHPAAPGSIFDSFVLPSAVSLMGGFNGTELFLSERDWVNNQTILSGDLADDDIFTNPWPSFFTANTPNSKHILTVSNAASGTTIDGITFTGGGAIQASGGAIMANLSELEIRNCTFSHNLGYQSAGTCIFLLDGFVRVDNCEFKENWGRFSTGVGIYVGGNAGTLVTKSRFLDNFTEADTSGGQGAGIALAGSTPSEITNCNFFNNNARPFGGQYISFGGAVYNSTAALRIDRCEFRNNSSVRGGAVYSWVGITVSNSLFENNNAYSSGAFSGNGGAVAVYGYNPYLLKMAGCTVANNRAHETAGVWASGFTTYSTDISNSVFWGNSDINGIVSQSSVKKASNSCVQNMFITIPGEDPIDPAKFPNCIDINPQFMNFPSDLHLTKSSPCIDTGNRSKFEVSWQCDLDNLPRFVDSYSAPNPGGGVSPLPDMGSFEEFNVLASVPTQFEVALGARLSGTLSNLMSADKNAVVIQPQTSSSGQSREFGILSVHHCPISLPGTLEFVVYSLTNKELLSPTLESYNAQTEQWEAIPIKVSGQGGEGIVGFVGTDAGRFVNDGEIRVRFSGQIPRLASNKAHQISIDHIVVRITY